MTWLGKCMMWAGFLSGSLAAVYQPEAPQRWRTIPPEWFGISALIGFIGVALIWYGRKSQRSDETSKKLDFETLRNVIGRLVESGQCLQSEQHNLAPSALVARIDELTAGDFQDFADNRQAMIDARGLQFYAEVMTQFAAAERAMNRAWSAAADGYLDEAETCLAKSSNHLEETQHLLSTKTSVVT